MNLIRFVTKLKQRLSVIEIVLMYMSELERLLLSALFKFAGMVD